MPNFNSTKAAAGTKARAYKVGALIEHDEVAVTGHTTADTLTMVTLPAGAIIHGFAITGTAALFATSCTLQFGDGTTAALFGSVSFLAVAPNAFVTVPGAAASIAPLAAEVPLKITISASSGAAGAQTLGVKVFYDCQGF